MSDIDWKRRYHELCSQCWAALGITTNTGKHIAEHIEQLQQRVDELEAELNTNYSKTLQQLDKELTEAEQERDRLRDLAVYFHSLIDMESPSIDDDTYREFVAKSAKLQQALENK